MLRCPSLHSIIRRSGPSLLRANGVNGSDLDSDMTSFSSPTRASYRHYSHCSLRESVTVAYADKLTALVRKFFPFFLHWTGCSFGKCFDKKVSNWSPFLRTRRALAPG